MDALVAAVITNNQALSGDRAVRPLSGQQHSSSSGCGRRASKACPAGARKRGTAPPSPRGDDGMIASLRLAAALRFRRLVVVVAAAAAARFSAAFLLRGRVQPAETKPAP